MFCLASQAHRKSLGLGFAVFELGFEVSELGAAVSELGYAFSVLGGQRGPSKEELAGQSRKMATDRSKMAVLSLFFPADFFLKWRGSLGPTSDPLRTHFGITSDPFRRWPGAPCLQTHCVYAISPV